MRDMTTPVTGNVYNSYDLIAFAVDIKKQEVSLVFSKGDNRYYSYVNGEGQTITGYTYYPQSYHTTKILNDAIITDSVIVRAGNPGSSPSALPVTNPYVTVTNRIQAGNWSPETTVVDFFEYVLKNYAGV